MMSKIEDYEKNEMKKLIQQGIIKKTFYKEEIADDISQLGLKYIIPSDGSDYLKNLEEYTNIVEERMEILLAGSLAIDLYKTFFDPKKYCNLVGMSEVLEEIERKSTSKEKNILEKVMEYLNENKIIVPVSDYYIFKNIEWIRAVSKEIIEMDLNDISKLLSSIILNETLSLYKKVHKIHDPDKPKEIPLIPYPLF